MITFITAMAAAAAAQTAQPAPASPQAQHMPMGQMDHSKMDHSRMDHSKMAQHGDGCCKQGADGKMECSMPAKAGSGSAHHGHSGH
jgi:hypothetical protein